MKVQIEISEKAFNLAVAQNIVLADSEKIVKAIKKAEEFCKINTVEIDKDNIKDKSLNLQVGLAMIGIAQVAEEILDKEENPIFE